MELIKDKTISERPTAAGDAVARRYVVANMSKNGRLSEDGSPTDSWNNNSRIHFESALYGKDEEDWDSFYYTVTLTEKINHLFSIIDNLGFPDLKTKATATVKISHQKRAAGSPLL